MRIARLLALAAAAAAAASGDSVVVNDFSAHVTGSGWGEGWFGPCNDAFGAGADHGLDFHMDFGGERGEVSAEISAPLPAGGCYLLEEHHPGRSESCSHYLPNNAPLTVHLADGAGDVVVLVDQSVNGGRWNALGHFDLAASGLHATFSNGGGSLSCGANICWWAADAWRFTLAPDAACQSDAASAASGEETAAASTAVAEDLPETVSMGQCAAFGAELLELVGTCNRATTCGAREFAMGHACRTAAAAFANDYEFVAARCLMAADKQELRTLLEMEAVLGCPEANNANELEAALEAAAASPSLRGDGAVAASPVTTEAADELDVALEAAAASPSLRGDGAVASSPVTTEAADAMVFDGDCSEFKVFAQQVVDHCYESSCCAEVVADDACRYYSAGLHALYPSNAINFCAAAVKLERKCSCFVRQVAACALQAEVHEILYNEQWAPTCSAFPAMSRQQDPALAEGSGAILWPTAILYAFAAVSGVATVVMCRSRATAEVGDGSDLVVEAEEVAAGHEVVVLGAIVEDAAEIKVGGVAPTVAALAVQ